MFCPELTGEEKDVVLNYTYRRDTKFKDMFNKAFDANIKMAWTRERTSKRKGLISLDCTDALLLKSNGKVVRLNVSEWCEIIY